MSDTEPNEEPEARRMAVVNDEGVVVNVVLVGDDDYDPGEGLRLVEDTDSTAGPGDIYDGKTFTRLEPEPVEPTRADELAAKIADGTATPEDRDEALVIAMGVTLPTIEPDEA